MIPVPVFHARVSAEGTLVLFDTERTQRRSYLRTLVGKDVDVIVRRKRNQRTHRQGRYYFGVVVDLIAEHLGYEKDEMHELLAMRFLRIDDDPVTGSPRRQRLPKTDTQEFSRYIDACIRFAAELGVVIPEAHTVAA